MKIFVTICSVAVVALALYGCGSGYISESPGPSTPGVGQVSIAGGLEVGGGVASAAKAPLYTDSDLAALSGTVGISCLDITNDVEMVFDIDSFKIKAVDEYEVDILKKMPALANADDGGCTDAPNKNNCLAWTLSADGKTLAVTGNIICEWKDKYTFEGYAKITQALVSKSLEEEAAMIVQVKRVSESDSIVKGSPLLVAAVGGDDECDVNVDPVLLCNGALGVRTGIDWATTPWEDFDAKQDINYSQAVVKMNTSKKDIDTGAATAFLTYRVPITVLFQDCSELTKLELVYGFQAITRAGANLSTVDMDIEAPGSPYNLIVGADGLLKPKEGGLCEGEICSGGPGS